MARIALAGIVGLTMGLIIYQHDRTAPSQIYSLICMGAALVTIIGDGVYRLTPGIGDPGRLSAQVISALGFLGSGLIWITNDNRVVGMSLASALWLIAILGMLIGIGLHNATVLGVFFFIIIYWLADIRIRRQIKK